MDPLGWICFCGAIGIGSLFFGLGYLFGYLGKFGN